MRAVQRRHAGSAFPFSRARRELPGMRTRSATTDTGPNPWRVPLAMAVVCVFVTAALTLAVPQLDSSDAQLLWPSI
jgi:hypothetical protein